MVTIIIIIISSGKKIARPTVPIMEQTYIIDVNILFLSFIFLYYLLGPDRKHVLLYNKYADNITKFPIENNKAN